MPTQTGTPGDDILYGTDDPDLIDGLAGNDRIFAFAGDDTLDGGDGNDLLDGGAGADAMSGGAGNDFYVVDNTGDTVTELASAGSDLVFTTIDYTLPDNVERLAAFDEASTYALTLRGNALNNEIIDNDGPDWLIGGGGTDVLRGGDGDDTYIVDSSSDLIGESVGRGYDTVYFDGATTNVAHPGFDYNASDYHIERLAVYDPSSTNSVNLLGSVEDNVLQGNDGINILDGGAGADALSGYGGDDIYFVGEAGDTVSEQVGGGYDTIVLGRYYGSGPLTDYTLPDNVERLIGRRYAALAHSLTGNGLDNEISGDRGANTLDGRGGHDVLIGYEGNDVFVFDSAPGEADADQLPDFQAGVDWIWLDPTAFSGLQPGYVRDSQFHRGGANDWQAQDADDRILYDSSSGRLYFDSDGSGATVPQLFATLHEGTNLTAGDIVVTGFVAGQTGTAGDDVLYGTDGADDIAGLDGHDHLFGFGGNDTLDGGAGIDILDGGTGADTMIGGTGNDYYIVDDPGDTVVERLGDTDTVLTSIDYALPTNVERAAVYDESSTYAIDLTGNGANNELIGNNGPNRLIGGGGTDVMYGFGGDDTYVLTSGSSFVHENAGGGFDTIYVDLATTSNFHVGFDYSLGINERRWGIWGLTHVEALGVYDPASTNSVNLEGSSNDDRLYGNDGINILDGYYGNDLMIGNGGNDYYYVDQAGDSIIEHPDGGYDTVLLGHMLKPDSAAFTFTLPDNVEHVAAARVGSGTAYNLIGNGLDNEMSGSDGPNTIDGKEGRDVLIGFGGSDTFVFSSALGDANADHVVDFHSGADRIALDRNVFTGLAPGALSDGQFHQDPVDWQAQDADDRILYDSTTGNLYFDPDGNGAASALLFASLHEGTALAASDFVVI
jgi:Ca2+-binding RTX toxin-like protein